MARKYFGTDGMRGEANKDLTIKFGASSWILFKKT